MSAPASPRIRVQLMNRTNPEIVAELTVVEDFAYTVAFNAWLHAMAEEMWRTALNGERSGSSETLFSLVVTRTRAAA